MFKSNWEKASFAHQLPQGMIEQMAHKAYPNKILQSYEIISGGCANLNVKINFKADRYPLILRIYLRDEVAAYKEQKLGILSKETAPIPLTYFIGQIKNYKFAVTEFMSGKSLREFLLDAEINDVSSVMYDVGETLLRISAHEFECPGFFDKDLNVIPINPIDDYLTFADECLKSEIVMSSIAPDIILEINNLLIKYKSSLPDQNAKSLVHGDFDPANIFVGQVAGKWKVTGILDWEFAFSGSILHDIANMLRYAHQMPSDFQKSFLNGLFSKGLVLPENWRITVHLLNLLSLLDCLRRSEPKTQPNKCTDIIELIGHILKEIQNLS